MNEQLLYKHQPFATKYPQTFFTSVFLQFSSCEKMSQCKLHDHMLFCGLVMSLIFQFVELWWQTGLALDKTFTVTALRLIPSLWQQNNTEWTMRYDCVIYLALLLHALLETGKSFLVFFNNGVIGVLNIFVHTWMSKYTVFYFMNLVL